MVSQFIHRDETHRPARLERGEYGSAEIRHYFYAQNWQCVEERARRCCGTECHSVLRNKADDSDVPAPEDLDPDMQYVWGLRYVDDLILRDRDTSTPKNGTLDERLYAMQDPNWNVVAVAESDGDVVERYLYSAYGDPVVLNGDFGEDSEGTDYAWEFRFTGRRTDLETDLMYYRNRMYHPGLGRFVSRDPIGYVGDSVSLYPYVASNPISRNDPTGLRVIIWQTYTCDDTNECYKVSAYQTKHTVMLGPSDCDKVNTAIMWGTIAAVSFELFEGAIASILAGAATGTLCECKATVRCKKFWANQWYGVYQYGVSMFHGFVANYYFTGRLGPTRMGVYDCQYKLVWKMAGQDVVDNGWVDLQSSWSEEQVISSADALNFPTYAPGQWTGWIDV